MTLLWIGPTFYYKVVTLQLANKWTQLLQYKNRLWSPSNQITVGQERRDKGMKLYDRILYPTLHCTKPRENCWKGAPVSCNASRQTSRHTGKQAANVKLPKMPHSDVMVTILDSGVRCPELWTSGLNPC